jgi:hypothetical protein
MDMVRGCLESRRNSIENSKIDGRLGAQDVCRSGICRQAAAPDVVCSPRLDRLASCRLPSLLDKPTPLNIDSGIDGFALFQ